MSDDPPPGEATAKYRLALLEARRAIDGQLALVEVTRQRALALVGLGGLVGTFVGSLGQGSLEERLTPALWIAFGSFGTLTILAMLTVWPWTMHSDLDPVVLVEDWIPRHTADDLDKTLALRVAQQHDDNKPTVAWLFRALLVMVMAVGVEFIALAYQLIGGS